MWGYFYIVINTELLVLTPNNGIANNGAERHFIIRGFHGDRFIGAGLFLDRLNFLSE